MNLTSHNRVARYNISFVPSSKPIACLTTKFGGQPVWAKKSAWPLSRATGRPMRFVGQIALIDIEELSACSDKIAYLFMTDSFVYGEDDVRDPYGQSDPESGENAVVIQPGGKNEFETIDLVNGPTLVARCEEFPPIPLAKPSVEYSVSLTKTTDPSYLDWEKLRLLASEKQIEYSTEIEGNKLCGAANTLGNDNVLPKGLENPKLLLQLEMGELPFYVDFGDIGTGFMFIDGACERGKFGYISS